MSKRLGIPEGRVLPTPIFEFFYKSDALHDPMVNDSHVEVLGSGSDAYRQPEPADWADTAVADANGRRVAVYADEDER